MDESSDVREQRLRTEKSETYMLRVIGIVLVILISVIVANVIYLSSYHLAPPTEAPP